MASTCSKLDLGLLHLFWLWLFHNQNKCSNWILIHTEFTLAAWAPHYSHWIQHLFWLWFSVGLRQQAVDLAVTSTPASHFWLDNTYLHLCLKMQWNHSCNTRMVKGISFMSSKPLSFGPPRLQFWWHKWYAFYHSAFCPESRVVKGISFMSSSTSQILADSPSSSF